MSVKHTKRNMVCAYDPLPEDLFVETWLIGSEGRFCLSTFPIDRYDEAVAWAVSMSDVMARHIELVPITGEEYLERNREGIQRYFASMTNQERGELRQLVVNTCTTVMRDSSDPDLRIEAHGVLLKLKVIKPC